MVTISTHNGSVFSQAHNTRKIKASNVDPEGHHETWFNVPIQKAYHQLFDKAVDAYNEKQTRPDRQIENYYRKIANDQRKHTGYEMIVEIGSGLKTIPKKDGYKILREFYQTWTKRNPSLVVFGAYYHADEKGAPHLHIDYIPVSENFKTGPRRQTGLKKALLDMGFETAKGKKTAQIQWEHRENQYLQSLVERAGYKVEHPLADTNVKHLKPQLAHEVEVLNLEHSNLQRNIKENVDQFKAWESENVAKGEKLKAQIAGLSEDRKRERYLLQQDQVSRIALKDEITTLSDQKYELEKEVDELEKKRDDLKALNYDLRDENKKMSNTLHETEKSIAELNESVSGFFNWFSRLDAWIRNQVIQLLSKPEIDALRNSKKIVEGHRERFKDIIARNSKPREQSRNPANDHHSHYDPEL